MLNLSIEELSEKIPELKKWLNGYARNSECTKKKYANDIKVFCNILELDSLESINNLDIDDFDVFLDYAISKNWSTANINNKLTVIKLFLKWLKKKDYISNNVIEDIKLLKNNQEVKYTMEIEDKDKLIESIKKHSKKTRMLLMVELCLATGLRISELMNLKLTDVGVDALRIYGKGSKIVHQPVELSLMDRLRVYIDTERKDNIDKYIKIGGIDLGCLFVGNVGNVDDFKNIYKNIENGNQVLENTFRQALKVFAQKADIKDWNKITPHGLRRLAGTCVYAQTKDPLLTQRFMRHSSFETTQKSYISSDKDGLRKIADEYTPLSIKAVKSEPIKSDREIELEKQLAELKNKLSKMT